MRGMSISIRPKWAFDYVMAMLNSGWLIADMHGDRVSLVLPAMPHPYR